MKTWTVVCFLFTILAGVAGCTVDDGQEEDTSFDSGEDTGHGDADYQCVNETVDTEECGPYPDHDNEMWDMFAVVPNMEFAAYADRDCDGEVELTTMRMYEDVYCQRDKIKSLVLAVGSNCGSADDGVS